MTKEQMAEQEFPYDNSDSWTTTIINMQTNAKRNAYVKGWESAFNQIEFLYKKWLKETERGGSVVTGKSMAEFFDYLKTN